MTSPLTSVSAAAASSITGATSSTSSQSSSATNATQSFGEQDFLKLLMAQLQNQDPLQPTDGTQFVTQLAQFTQVEQQVSQTSTLSNISSQLQSMSNANAAGLIGQTVTMSTGALNWNGSFAPTANVTLGAAATQVTASVQDGQGNVVRTMQLGAAPGGVLPITWDGKADNGQVASTGTYSVAVTAKNANGQPVAVSQTLSGVVSSVSYNNGSATLNLASGASNVPLSQLVSVGTASGH